MQYSGINPLAYSDLPREKLSNGTSIASTLQQLSISFGVALSAMLLILFGADTKTSMYIPEIVIQHTFMILGTFTMLSATAFLNLHKDDGLALYAKG